MSFNYYGGYKKHNTKIKPMYIDNETIMKPILKKIELEIRMNFGTVKYKDHDSIFGENNV